MKHAISHDLDHDLARRATRAALREYAARFPQYQPAADWLDLDRADIRFTVAGRTLRGAVQVGPETIGLELDVPLVFAAFRTVAIRVIEDEIRAWVQRAREGKLDQEPGGE